ncbi:MAG: DnaJ C-terminal domain-containing protein [Alphaproteobacteria bacterium]
MADTVDPYRALGVSRSASTEDVRKAFRAAAKECHPDLYPDDPVRAERFKQISWAHTLLTDDKARHRFDVTERVQARAQERPSPAQGKRSQADGGQRAERRFRFPGIDGSDIDYTVEVTVAEAKAGVRKALQTTDGRTLRVAVPANVQEGHVLRLRGQGMPGKFGGTPGDALVTVQIGLPSAFRTAEDGVHCDLDVPLATAVLGGKVTAPTIDGSVTISIPPASNGGDILRLRGRGLAGPAGTRSDQFVHLRIVLPKPADPELERLLREWAARKVGAV